MELVLDGVSFALYISRMKGNEIKRLPLAEAKCRKEVSIAGT